MFSWSRLSEPAAAARERLRTRSLAVFARLPRPVRQACRLVERTIRGALEDRILGLAAEVALFTLISLPALLLAIVGSLGFVAAALGPEGTAELRELVLGIPRPFLADTTFASYQQIVEDVLARTRGGVVSFGIVLSIWTGSRAVNRYLETITIAYGVPPRPGWRQRLLAVGLTVGFLVGGVAVLPALVFGTRLLEWLTPQAVTETTLQMLGLLFWPGVVLIVVAGLTTLYHVGVPWKTAWRRELPGALLALILWLLASAGLRTYLAVSIHNDAVFGQLAVPIAVVLWLYITAVAVLLGAEFNAQIERLWPSGPQRLDQAAK